jgi:hypothetical protein
MKGWREVASRTRRLQIHRDGYACRVAAERGDVLLDPLQGEALVKKTGVL